jgi:serine/threonine protein kinase/class 3 adenylate cyclase
LIGKNFGAYKIEAKLGEGGMGVVYRARDIDLDRPVAIKMMLDSAVPGIKPSPDAIARFLREAKAASRLQHPAIVHIYKYGVEDATRYLAMEYIEGRNLRVILNRQSMPIERICEIGAQIGDGLVVAHEMGVVHRDLKLENIMVTARGQVKILDFGLAKVSEPINASADATLDDNCKTQLGTILGTASSMSPEQAMGREVDAKADIFSVGVVLYEMATGQNPFAAPTAQATLARILNHQPELVSLINPAVPPELERLIHLCLRKEPKERPSAQEVTNTCKRLMATMSKWGPSDAEATSVSMGPSLVNAQAAPPAQRISGVKPPSASKVAFTQPVAITHATLLRLSATYRAIKVFRFLFRLATLTVPLSFFFYMLVGANVVRPQVVEGTWLWKYVQAIVIPVLTESEKVFTFRPVVNGWNLMLAGLGIVLFIVRHLVLLPVERMEFSAKAKWIKARNAGPQQVVAPISDRGVNNRLALLRQYSEGKRESGSGKRIAFLSVDVVGWPRMIAGEDPLVAEHAHAEYKKFVDRVLRTCGAVKTSFTSEGVISALPTADQAVSAAQSILKELNWFNDGIHRLRSPFHVRCGINAGDVALPDDKRLEEVHNDVIDIAAHMQKAAPPDVLWLSGEVLALVADSSGFDMVTGCEVDGRTTYEWRAPASNPSVPKSGSAVGAD